MKLLLLLEAIGYWGKKMLNWAGRCFKAGGGAGKGTESPAMWQMLVTLHSYLWSMGPAAPQAARFYCFKQPLHFRTTWKPQSNPPSSVSDWPTDIKRRGDAIHLFCSWRKWKLNWRWSAQILHTACTLKWRASSRRSWIRGFLITVAVMRNTWIDLGNAGHTASRQWNHYTQCGMRDAKHSLYFLYPTPILMKFWWCHCQMLHNFSLSPRHRIKSNKTQKHSPSLLSALIDIPGLTHSYMFFFCVGRGPLV